MTCPVCGRPMERKSTGRPGRYCSSGCRVKAHRWNSIPQKRGRVLIACESSGKVRDAFTARGWDAWSADLLPSETTGQHYQGDARDLLYDYPGNENAQQWDLLIAHPPCTHLSVSGNRYRGAKPAYLVRDAIGLVQDFMAAPVPHIAVENPVSIIASEIRPSDQTIHPWQYGHGEVKQTCLWLTNLPKLEPTNVVEGRESRVHRMPPSDDRWRERSKTYAGIAVAIADQWGRYVESSQLLL